MRAYAPHVDAIERPKHPRAIAALVLGILSISGFSILTGVPAWYLGARVRSDCRSYPGEYSGETEATVGMWLGAVTVVSTVGFLLLFAGVFFYPFP